MTARVLLVDDHTMLREAIAAAVDRAPDMAVVGEASSIGTALEALRHTTIHAAVLDVSLPDGNGLALVRKMRGVSATVGIVVLTMHDDDTTLRAARDAGASAFVNKTRSADAVLSAIRAAVRQPSGFVAEGLEERVAALDHTASHPDSTPSAPPVHLTARERQVLAQLAAGSSIARVAASLYMSESTVKTHTARLYDKLGAHNRAAAIMAAVRLGLVDPDAMNEPSPR